MATITGTVTLNAAFLQEIKEDNRELRLLLEEATSTMRGEHGAHLPARRMAEMLDQLRDQFAIHFSLEEAYGYFDEAVNVTPRLSEEAERLRDEHRTLYELICELAELGERRLYGESPSIGLSDLARRFLAFRHRFDEHEERENDLILATLDDDLGVGD